VVNINGGTITSEGTVINTWTDFIVGDTGSGASFIAKGGTHSVLNLVVGKGTLVEDYETERVPELA
jgi:hypothetical protein